MSRKRTRAELEAEIVRLQPYVEATICLQRMLTESPKWPDGYTLVFSGEPGEDSYRSIRIVGIDRAGGGVVIAMQGDPCGAQWLTDVINTWSRSINPYEREVASKAQRALKEAVEKRFQRGNYDRVVVIDGVRYGRVAGFGSPLAELRDYSDAAIPDGRVIAPDDPRHPDREATP